MTKDEHGFTYVDSLRGRAGEALWAEFVEFVAEFIASDEDDGSEALALKWREEMGNAS